VGRDHKVGRRLFTLYDLITLCYGGSIPQHRIITANTSSPDAPKLPSVSVSPSAEIVEGSSVTLTCSSDANPAAKYTWFKENLLKGQGQSYYFPSIRSEDRGIYYCQAENKHGQIKSLQHLLDLPSVSVSPSAEIVEGSSVTLTCSSDANPAANYTWFKEDEDSPTASGQIFTISNFSADHSGRYYCEAQNTRGRHNSTLHLLVVTGKLLTFTCLHVSYTRGFVQRLPGGSKLRMSFYSKS
uniref:Ig-like domain-containing protein n=1 Tax=Labrus bergylta TaxID=56723 RepID=A0A3Q3E6W6_9LABR